MGGISSGSEQHGTSLFATIRYDSSMETFAILIDYENFTCSPEGLRELVQNLSQRGTLVVKRAYADWVKLAGYRQHLLACQIEMIELACATKGKNSADIRLVVDAMELLFTKPHITTFVILSADSDFLPLLNRLREQNKRTIVVASNRNIQPYMRTHCDEFIDGDVYLGKSRKKVGILERALVVPPEKRLPTSEQILSLRSSILQVWRSHGLHLPMGVSELGGSLKRMHPELEWKAYGFKSMKPMVAFFVSNGFLRIDLANQTGDRIYLAHPADHVRNEPPPTHAELGPLIASLVQGKMRWRKLRDLLIQSDPRWVIEMQNDDSFLKQLQVIDALGFVDVTYESSQNEYFVFKSRSSQASKVTDRTNDNSVTHAENECIRWTQPELF